MKDVFPNVSAKCSSMLLMREYKLQYTNSINLDPVKLHVYSWWDTAAGSGHILTSACNVLMLYSLRFSPKSRLCFMLLKSPASFSSASVIVTTIPGLIFRSGPTEPPYNVFSSLSLLLLHLSSVSGVMIYNLTTWCHLENDWLPFGSLVPLLKCKSTK